MNCGNCRYGQEMLIESGRVFDCCPIRFGILLFYERGGVYYELEHGGNENWQCLNSVSPKYKQKVKKSSKCNCWSSKKDLSESDGKNNSSFDNYTCEGQITLGESV